jgi:hypothetical protein
MVKLKIKRKVKKGRTIVKVSHLRKPEDMPLEQWRSEEHTSELQSP